MDDQRTFFQADIAKLERVNAGGEVLKTIDKRRNYFADWTGMKMNGMNARPGSCVCQQNDGVGNGESQWMQKLSSNHSSLVFCEGPIADRIDITPQMEGLSETWGKVRMEASGTTLRRGFINFINNCP